jgi:hypothetical protein
MTRNDEQSEPPWRLTQTPYNFLIRMFRHSTFGFRIFSSIWALALITSISTSKKETVR